MGHHIAAGTQVMLPEEKRNIELGMKYGDELIRICGIAKGSGMIAPNLATMLSFIFTNADINSNLLKTLLKRAVANSFNAITVDSDQSTNDMVSIFSTRKIKIGHNRGLLKCKASFTSLFTMESMDGNFGGPTGRLMVVILSKTLDKKTVSLLSILKQENKWMMNGTPMELKPDI